MTDRLETPDQFLQRLSIEKSLELEGSDSLAVSEQTQQRTIDLATRMGVLELKRALAVGSFFNRVRHRQLSREDNAQLLRGAIGAVLGLVAAAAIKELSESCSNVTVQNYFIKK